MDVIKRLLSYLKPHWKTFAAAVFLLCIFIVLQMVNPYLSGFVVDQIILGNKRELLVPVCLVIALTALLKSSVRYLQSYLAERTSQKAIQRIRHQLYNHIQEMDFHFFDKTRTGELMSRMIGDLDAIRHFLAGICFALLESFIYFTVVAILFFSTNVILALVALCLSPLLCYGSFRLAGAVKPAFADIRQQFARLNSAAQENITGVRVVRSFAQEEQEKEKFSYESKEFMNKNVHSSRVWSSYMPVLDFLSGASTALLLGAGGYMVINGTITLGNLVSFSSYMWMLIMPMRMLGWHVNDIQRAVAAGEKIFQLLDTRPAIMNPAEAYVPEKMKGHIEFKNVWFKYDEDYVLENISFDLKPGKTLALMGTTGAGKTSIINLINRFYDVDKGTILIDGVDIRQYNLKALRDKISVVMQETFLFSDNVKENIGYGKPDATLDEVIRAAKIANAHDFILEMPQKYDTIIGERGIGLSGGQKQRVSIARAVLKNPTILIMDDATSAVDMETEHEIQQELKEIFKDRTSVVIAHRISSVKNADEILVLDNGKILERGTHHELLHKKGVYYNIYCEQYKDYAEILEKKEVI